MRLFKVGNMSLKRVSLFLTNVNECLDLDIRAVGDGVQLRATEVVRGEALVCPLSHTFKLDGLKFRNCIL
jgi:hypothetical protein